MLLSSPASYNVLCGEFSEIITLLLFYVFCFVQVSRPWQCKLVFMIQKSIFALEQKRIEKNYVGLATMEV